MKTKKNVLFSLMAMLAGIVNFTLQAQLKNDVSDAVKTINVFTAEAPKSIVRNIKQDKKGNIWVTSWEGVYKYDGKSFTNVTRNVSSARFFSVLEDRKGKLWFASIGSGLYYYDGKSFQNFTTQNGLASDRVAEIYQDKTGTIWFGTEKGASLYDGKSFQNLKMSPVSNVSSSDSVYVGPKATRSTADSVHVSAYQRPLPEAHWMHNDVNAIIEDNTGKFWLGTRGNAVFYDGKAFATVTNNGKPFTNVRSIIKDKKGNIWLAGFDGLWRYDGSAFTNFTQDFVGYVYEDRKGNIWTSSESKDKQHWTLSRYDAKTLSDKDPIVTAVVKKPMIFGILEDDKGNIWFGDFDGVHRYDGKVITDFKSEK